MSKSRIEYNDMDLLRIKIACSIITGRSLRIANIEQGSNKIEDYHTRLLKLVELLTNGSFIKISENGKQLDFVPGSIIGGNYSFDSENTRGLGYFIQFLLMIVPFLKNSLTLTLTGITDDLVDPSVDYLNRSSVPVVAKFMGGDNPSLRIEVKRRGPGPNGGGAVVLSASPSLLLKPRQLTDCGKVNRIRGIAWTVGVSPSISGRIAHSARSILNKFIPDIYINTHHTKGIGTGKSSPGFGLTLWARTTTGVIYSAHACSKPRISEEKGVEDPSTPEDVGLEAGNRLICEIYKGGFTCSANQFLICWMMLVNQTDVSKVVMPPPSLYTIGTLRLFRDFFGVTFKIDKINMDDEVEQGGSKLTYTCVGVGYKNSNIETL